MRFSVLRRAFNPSRWAARRPSPIRPLSRCKASDFRIQAGAAGADQSSLKCRPAIGDDLLLSGHALCRELTFCIVRICECLGCGVVQCRGRNIDASRDATWPAVAARFKTLMELSAKRVDDDHTRIVPRRKDGVLVDKKSGPRRRSEGPARIAFWRPAFDRASFDGPFFKAAIKH